MEQPNPEAEDQREAANNDHLDVTAQYGGGKDWANAPATGIRGWWRRLRGD